ncbi:trichohyalin [Clarias gariepinus]|uniref:trichohyalin n=1 Tax=Clarias gariepinus TaxID=13013 RepID=UPI00234C55E6|nr:trichohyalin [Clarias gariepinus]
MEDTNHDGADDTDELLCTEVISDFGVGASPLHRDHCDFLLDAIDAQLSRLQSCSYVQANGGNGKREDILGLGEVRQVFLDRSTSASKDTGLGTDKASSAPEGLNSDHADLTAVELSRSGMELGGRQGEECEERVGVGTAALKDSKRDQCLWRLERLLGAGTGVTRKEEADEEDSVRTEDFSARFIQEMLEPTKLNTAESILDFDVPDSVSISSDTTLLTEPRVSSSRNTEQNPSLLSYKSPSRQLAGVPLKCFDLVSIDSDLDSVCTEQVREHLQGTLANRIAQEGLLDNRSGEERTSAKTTQQAESQTVSSEDEPTTVSVRCYRVPRSPASFQRREKRTQGRRNDTSTSSTASTASKAKTEDKIKSELICVGLSLADLKKEKETAAHGVERLRQEVEEAEKEQHTLHLSVAHTRTHTELLRSELQKLQAQRDSYAQEVKALQESQAALQRHITNVHQDSRHVHSGCASALEREEMDRLLDNAKSELFSEQRRFRHTLDSMQDRLEEVTQELEQKQEENRKLRDKCTQLKEKLSTTTKTRQELQECVRRERVEQEGRIGALEKIVAQKELVLLATQQEKSHLEMEIRTVREEHRAKLTAALEHAQKQKEVEVEQLRTQMTLTQAEELQRVRIQVHELKEAALREQAVAHTRHTESLHTRIQMKDEEVTRLQESLKQQQEEMRRREEELRGETQEQVRRGEEQRAESLRELQVRLEKQMQEVERRGRAEVEREKRSTLALQNKVLELQKTVDELDSAASKQTAVIRALRDEHQTELFKLRRRLLQEAESEAVRLRECVKRSEQELQAMRAQLAESERLQQGAAMKHEQQDASWAQDIHTECVCLHELLVQNGCNADNTHLTHSGTVSEAVQVLQSLRKSLQHLISNLQNHISSLTRAKQQLSADKDEELRVQREQLTAEKEKAINTLREKLIQDHIEELSSLSRVHLHDDDEREGVAARLRRQLRAKDEELRQVQRSMAQWKEKTAARLARKFEQEVTSELERWKVDWLRKRKACRQKSEQHRRLEQLEEEMRHLTASSSEIANVSTSSASSAHVPDAAMSSHDLDSYKLLRHLQSRIRLLQADTQSQTHTYTLSAARLHRDRGNRERELAGSYLETISQARDSSVTRQRSDLKTALKPDL